MSKQIVAVDIDDVLLPHYQDLIDWYNGLYGTNLTLADRHSRDLKLWNASTEAEAIRRVHKFYDTEIFKQAKPFEAAKHVVALLDNDYELAVITARDTLIEQITHDWLRAHFQQFFGAVHFTAQYSLEGKNRSKVDVCREINATYLIDDDLKNVTEAAGIGVKGLLFGEYPWNQVDELPKGLTRCKDWAAVLEYFEDESDLAIVEQRKHEPTITHEQFMKELKNEGLL